MMQPLEPHTAAPSQGRSAMPYPDVGASGQSRVAQVLAARDARERRQKKAPAAESMSLLTQAAQELTKLGAEMREEFKKNTPAPFMKAKMTRRTARQRFLQMPPEEHVMLARKIGVKMYVNMARHLGFNEDALPIGGKRG